MYLIYFAVAFFACVIGKICGMGGGVIIKPVLDASGLMSVAAINFLSGCTVIGMTCWSVGKAFAKRESQIDLAISTPLALGAATGGLLGKYLFTSVAGLFANANTAGGVQACLLFAATFATLLYTANRQRFAIHPIENKLLCVVIGLMLGVLGTFLGIGGGPFNVAVLFFFFSMSAKVAAQNSLYIILISQTMSVLATVLSGGVPDISAKVLCGMVLCGIVGGEVGGRISGRLSESRVTRLFEASMVLVMLISAYNISAALG